MPPLQLMGVAKAALEASVRYMTETWQWTASAFNAISAGPIKTLAGPRASAISAIILKWNELNSPLRRNVTIDDVGVVGASTCCPISGPRSPCGGLHHVDAGYHVPWA